MIIYVAGWSVACIAAIVLFATSPRGFAIGCAGYWRLLAEPWKLATFAVAWAGIALVAPYTGDPTWDYFDASFMAILTFTTAPWACGTLYRAAHRNASAREVYVAACAWLFSASWSYDLYLLIRDGEYPNTWLPNLFASSVLYAAAGLMWSLHRTEGRGVVFSFMDSRWPDLPPTTGLGRLFLYALPFMVLATLAIGYFLLP